LNGRSRNAVLSEILVWETSHGGTQSIGSNDPGDDKSIIIQPNPSSGKTELIFTIIYQSETRLQIYDASGELVLSSDMGLLAAGKHKIRLGDKITPTLPGGVYFVELNVGNTTLRGRIVHWK
jgi:hypothetical protein